VTCVKRLYGKPVLDQLIMAHVFADYAMPMETVIVGDERGRFLYGSWDESRNVCGSTKYISEAVALVFARDSDKSSGIYFYVYLYRTLLFLCVQHELTKRLLTCTPYVYKSAFVIFVIMTSYP
jgi:hypothetical protein